MGLSDVLDFDLLFRWLVRPEIRFRLGSFGVLEETRPAARRRREPGGRLAERGWKVSSCDRVGFRGGVKQVKLHAVRLPLSSAEFVGESNEKPFRPADVAEPIRVFILDYLPNELRTAPGEPFKRLVDVVHGEHSLDLMFAW